MHRKAMTTFAIVCLLSAPIARAGQGKGDEQPLPDTSAAGADKVPALQVPPANEDELQQGAQKKTPLSPQQIIQYRKHQQAVERAEKREVTPVVPVIKTTVIDPTNFKRPPVLRLRVGYSTTLVFRDSTGEPYKVKPLNFGDQKAYKVKQDGDNVLTVYATDAYQASNMTVQLDGIDAPLVLHLVNGEDKVDYMRYFTIQRLSPATRKKLALKAGQPDPTPVVNDPNLQHFLDDLPPAGAQIVPVMEPGVQAWWFHHKLIVRTRYTLTSPEGTPLHGEHGWRVYEIFNPLTPMLFQKDGHDYWVHVALDEVPEIAQVGRTVGGGPPSDDNDGGDKQ